MNTQRAYTQEMEEAFASIQLEDEEQEGLNYENNVLGPKYRRRGG